MAKARDDGLRWIDARTGGSGGSRAMSLMAPSDQSRRVNLRPSDRAVAEMRARGVTHVRAAWGVNASGEVEWLKLTPAQDGSKVRYDNRKLRPHVHLPTGDAGTAVDAPSGSRICPEEVIDGDEFKFKVPNGLRFEKGGEANATSA